MPRIALDVGTDAVFFDNPDLPDTRSEMALPLQLSGRILGALDVQSIHANTFQPEDVDVLATLADQVAVAIQTVQTFEINQRYLEEARRSASSYLNESWRALTPGAQTWGYAITNNTVTLLDQGQYMPMLTEGSARVGPVLENGQAASLAVPIRLAGRAVGALRIQLPDHEWDPDEVDIITAVAERLSLALESTTLLEATQKRAEIERLTADITGKIGSTTQIDSILRTAAEELSRVLGGSDVLVQIQPNVLEAGDVRSR
jgi:GAF domain-containing protein